MSDAEISDDENPDVGWPRSNRTENAREGLFVSDAELIRRLGVGVKTGRIAIATLEKSHVFPVKDPLFGNKRFWPAVRRALNHRCMPTIDHAGRPFFASTKPQLERWPCGDGKIEVRNRDTGKSWIEDAKPNDPKSWQKKRKLTPRV